MKREGMFMYKQPFIKFNISNKTINLPLHLKRNQMTIDRDVMQFDKDEMKYKEKYEEEILKLSENVKVNKSIDNRPLSTSSIRKQSHLRKKIRNQDTPTEPSSYSTPLNINLITNKINNLNSSTITPKSSMQNTFNTLKRDSHCKDIIYYSCSYGDDDPLDEVDFALIDEIDKQKREVDSKINKLNLNIKRTKTQLTKYIQYIPINRKFQDIDFNKKCIFNKEFTLKKKRNITTGNFRMEQKRMGSIENDGRDHLREIKNVLMKDKNLTYNSIMTGIKKRDNNYKMRIFLKKVNQNHTRMKENSLNKMKIYLYSRPFEQLKNAFNKDKKSLISSRLSRNIRKLCEIERNEIEQNKQFISDNIYLRLNENNKKSIQLHRKIKLLSKNSDKMQYILRKIITSPLYH